jgi:hypothetical protein
VPALLAALLSALAVTLALAVPASAGTPSFVLYECGDPERVHYETDLCRIDPDGRGARRLTNDAVSQDEYRFPTLTRDGTRIAFARGGSTQRLFTAPLDLSSPTELAGVQVWESAISPDGRRVAYVEAAEPIEGEPEHSSTPVLFTVDSDGTNRRKWGRMLMFPTWVGDRLAAVVGGLHGGRRACLLLEGSGICERTIAEVEKGELRQPAVSPDGRLVAAYVSPDPDLWIRPGIWTFAAKTGRRTGGIVGGLVSGDPVWSPDGRAIAFTDAGSIEVRQRPGPKESLGTPGYTLWNHLQKAAAGHPAWVGARDTARARLRITRMSVRGRRAVVAGTAARKLRGRLRAEFSRGGGSVASRTFYPKVRDGRFAFAYRVPREHPGDGHWWCGINLSYPGGETHGWDVVHGRPRGGVCR